MYDWDTAIFRNDKRSIINSLIDIKAITPTLITVCRIAQKILAEAFFPLELPKEIAFYFMPDLGFDIRYLAIEWFQ